MNNRLAQLLRDRGIAADVIQKTLDSGYFLKDWVNPGSAQTYVTVSDLMYGSKQFSSSFETDDFIQHLLHEDVFEPLPPFRELIVRNSREVRSVLDDPHRQRYIADGSLSFRGQNREHSLRRPVPNPRRADRDGREKSIMPGLYRQNTVEYSFSARVVQSRSFELILHELEPNNNNVFADSRFAYDIMRTEQHYATPTGGLDLSFDVETALFFATHKFRLDAHGIATYERVAPGSHSGVIYCLRFGSPSVKKTEYYIRDFDLFKTYRPERILRQACALPLIGDFERNIAITELDCIIRLHCDFVYDGTLTPEYMFPGAREDAFYRKLLEVKDRHPKQLATVVEYAWARA